MLASCVPITLVLAAVLPIPSQGVATTSWSCPLGWEAYSDDDPITCVVLKSSIMSNMEAAHDECVKLNASLIVINSEKKLAYFRKAVKLHKDESFWLGLIKKSDKVLWKTKDGNIPASLPQGLHISSWSGDQHHWMYRGFLYSHYSGSMHQPGYYDQSGKYICEKPPDCKKGFYGKSCENSCHCHGQLCDPTDFTGICHHGCDLGWMGTSCSQAKEDATVKYYCVKSPDLGNYVHVRIHTKGVHYDKIQAVDKHGHYIGWCNSTEVTFNQEFHTKTIKIKIDDDATAEMLRGECAGTASNKTLSWHIKMQEKAGFESRNDQEFFIACDQFTVYDSLSVSANVAVDVDQRQVELIARQREGVKMKVVDAFTGEPLATKAVGSSVAAKIYYGLNSGSDAAGVVPYNCEATTKDGGHKVKLLDAHGCPVPGSILSEFQHNGSKSLVTEPFPLPRLPGSKHLHLQCSYILCYDNDPCPEGCQPASNGTVVARHRRSAGPEEHRVTTSLVVDMPSKLTKNIHFRERKSGSD